MSHLNGISDVAECLDAGRLTSDDPPRPKSLYTRHRQKHNPQIPGMDKIKPP